jgi:hypothetical protein
MVGFTQTGKRVLLTGVTPRSPGLYWVCDVDTVAVSIVNVSWDGTGLFARELVSGETIDESEFRDLLWAEASERDAEDMRQVHVQLKLQQQEP